MNRTTRAPPAAEPVGLAEAKAHLRIGFEGEDDLVEGLIAGARARIEAASGIAMIRRTLKVQRDSWPRGTVESRGFRLPVRPASSLTSVTLRDRAGEAVDVTGRFVLEAGSGARLVWAGGAFPWPLRATQGIEIVYVAGFGEGPDDIAADLRLAVLKLAAHAYRTRDPETLALPLPADVMGLLSPWRRVRL